MKTVTLGSRAYTAADARFFRQQQRAWDDLATHIEVELATPEPLAAGDIVTMAGQGNSRFVVLGGSINGVLQREYQDVTPATHVRVTDGRGTNAAAASFFTRVGNLQETK